MTEIRGYILSIVAVSMICSIVIHFTKSTKVIGEFTRMLCGILVALFIFSPIVQLRWNDFADYMDKLSEDAKTTAYLGTQTIQQAKADSIQQQLQAYILDKASSYNCDLNVDVELSEEDPPVPVRISIQGTVSPYEKAQLSAMIEKDLGIPKEMQKWNAVN